MNKPNFDSKQRILYWVKRLSAFDFWTDYSDDSRVWEKGDREKSKLREEIKNANLTQQEKDVILRIIGYRFIAQNQEDLEFYNCIPELSWEDSVFKKTCEIYLK